MVVNPPYEEHIYVFVTKGLEYLMHDLVVRYLDSRDQEDGILLVSILSRFSPRGILSGYK